MTEVIDIAPNEVKQEHSFFARLLAATGFSIVGAKLGLLALPIDANAIFDKEKLTFKEKVNSIFDGTFKQKLGEKATILMQKDFAPILERGIQPTQQEIIKSSIVTTLKLTKYSTIIGIVGMGAGAILGWVRGGLIENWKDIFTHPLDSTKIVLGFEAANKNSEIKKETGKLENTNFPMENDAQKTSAWENYVKSRKQKINKISKSASEIADTIFDKEEKEAHAR